MKNPFFELDCSKLEYPACKEEATKRFGPPSMDLGDGALFFTHDGVLVSFKRCRSLGKGDEGENPSGPGRVVLLVHGEGKTYRFDSPRKVEFLLLKEGERAPGEPNEPELGESDWRRIYEEIAHSSLMSRLQLPKNRAERREIQRYLGNEGRHNLSLFFRTSILKDEDEVVHLA